jgi:hypothetical protein
MADWQKDLDRAREEARKAREEATRLRQEARELGRKLRQEGRDRAREERHQSRAERHGPPGAGPGSGWRPNWEAEAGEGARAEESFSLEGVRQVVVDQTAGRVTIRPCQEGETPGVISSGNKSAPRLEVTQEGDRLTILLKLSTGWLFRRKQGATTIVRLAANVPELKLNLGYGEAHIREIESETIRIDVGAGTVNTTQTAGYLRANIGAGKLAVHGHAGIVDCDTGTGDIMVDVSRLVAGEYKVDAGIGRAEVRLPEGEQVHFRVSSGMGKTRIEYPDAGEGAPTVVRINGYCRGEREGAERTRRTPPATAGRSAAPSRRHGGARRRSRAATARAGALPRRRRRTIAALRARLAPEAEDERTKACPSKAGPRPLGGSAAVA